MAEGFAKAYAPPGMEIFSAGSTPAQKLNSVAGEAMKERGIDISHQEPKGIDALADGTFDVVVGMGCGDACPAQRAKQVFTWEVPNPKGQPIEVVREIRDQIETQVQILMEEIRHGP